MKLIATKTEIGILLSEINPYKHNWPRFERTKFSMLTDDILEDGQEVDREDYEIQWQVKCLAGHTRWETIRDEEAPCFNFKGTKWDTRQILRRKDPIIEAPEKSYTIQDLYKAAHLGVNFYSTKYDTIEEMIDNEFLSSAPTK